MSNRKNQNSILFLTTLGVYLGLLMVGATPGVIAQHGKANKPLKVNDRFACELKHLIFDERSEDIDPFAYNLARRFVELAEATKGRLEFVTVDEPSEQYGYPFYFRQVDFASYIGPDGRIRKDEWDSESSEWASASHAGQMVDVHSIFLTALADCTEPTKEKLIQTSASFTMDADSAGFELIIRKASNERAYQLASTLESHFKADVERHDYRQTVVYANTSIKSTGNQVFIVTRLPRAGLDALLAKDAK